MYENKIAVVVLNELATWQKLNVAAFLAGAVAMAHPETQGAPLVTATGTEYLPFIKYPVLVYGADTPEQLTRAFKRARERDLRIGIYTRELFATRNEAGNLAEIARFPDDLLNLAGIIVYGDPKKVDKTTDKLKLHS